MLCPSHQTRGVTPSLSVSRRIILWCLISFHHCMNWQRSDLRPSHRASSSQFGHLLIRGQGPFSREWEPLQAPPQANNCAANEVDQHVSDCTLWTLHYMILTSNSSLHGSRPRDQPKVACNDDEAMVDQCVGVANHRCCMRLEVSFLRLLPHVWYHAQPVVRSLSVKSEPRYSLVSHRSSASRLSFHRATLLGIHVHPCPKHWWLVRRPLQPVNTAEMQRGRHHLFADASALVPLSCP